MAVWICCNSSLTEGATSELIVELNRRYPDVLQYFWISEPGPCDNWIREEEAKNGLSVKCGFIIQRNNDEGSRFLNVIPKLLYEVFGRDRILVHGFDYELIRPEEAYRIAAAARTAEE